MKSIGDANWSTDGSGYFHLPRYDRGVSELASHGFIEDKLPGRTVSRQYDHLGADSRHLMVRSTEMSAANVFVAEQDEALTSVGATTQDDRFNVQVAYAILRLREGVTSPVDGELCDTISCLYAYRGYHREQLDVPMPLSAGDRLSVVVTQTARDASGKMVYAICANIGQTEAQARKLKDTYYGRAVVHRGESWACIDGRWQD